MLTAERYTVGSPPGDFTTKQQIYLKTELQAIARSFARQTIEQSYNTSMVSQGPGFATDTWIAGSQVLVPPAGWQFGTLLEWRIVASKTAAGVAAPVFAIRGGRLLSTSDTLITTVTGNAQTAATDDAVISIYAAVQDLTTRTGTLVSTLQVLHSNAATGFTNTNVGITTQSAAVSIPFYGDQYLSLSLNAGAAAAWTITQVRAHALW